MHFESHVILYFFAEKCFVLFSHTHTRPSSLATRTALEQEAKLPSPLPRPFDLPKAFIIAYSTFILFSQSDSVWLSIHRSAMFLGTLFHEPHASFLLLIKHKRVHYKSTL